MITKAIPTGRGEGIAAERFGEMIASPSFAKLRARIEGELARASQACEREDKRRALYRAQGAAAALRTVLGLPKVLHAELRNPKRADAPTGE